MEDDGEEELRVGAERTPKRLQRPGMVVLVGLVGLGGAFLVTRGSGDGGSTATPSPSPGVTTSAISSASITVMPVEPEVFPPTRVPICPGGKRCVTSGALPASAVAALREQYPQARVTSTTTLTAIGGGAELLRRSITAVAGPRTFDIVITPFVLGPDSFDRQNTGTTSTVSAESTGSGKTVSIKLVEPRVARPNDLIVLRLARDPRLAALR